MICKQCSKNDVCKHYEYLKINNGLTLSNCDYKFDKVKPNSKITSEANIYSPSSVTLLSNTANERGSVSSKIQELNSKSLAEEEIDFDFKVVDEPTALSLCTTCNSHVYEKDLIKCDICNSDMCIACGTRSYDCDSQKFINICDKCDADTEINNIEKNENIIDWREHYGKNTNDEKAPK